MAISAFANWHLGQNLSFQPSGILGNISQSANWVDVVAAQGSKATFSPKVLVTGAGDAGGGGANLDYQVTATVSTQNFNPKHSLTYKWSSRGQPFTWLAS